MVGGINRMPSARSRTQPFSDSVAGQHLALSVAAHLARTQLVPEPLKVYDSQHLSEMMNHVAMALARTATLYVYDGSPGEPRQLTPAELEGAVAKRSATVLVLKGGRALAGVSMRRGDLRQAIAILKAIGLQEIAPQLPVPPDDARPGKPASPEINGEALLARLAEIEVLLQPPLIAAQVDKAKAGALFIARHAPHGRVANLAMQLMSALQEACGTDDVPGGFRMSLARLRAALHETTESPDEAVHQNP
jgi:hypothetical protein